MESESGFSFAIASQPFRFLALIFIPMPTFATGDRSDAQMQMDENWNFSVIQKHISTFDGNNGNDDDSGGD